MAFHLAPTGLPPRRRRPAQSGFDIHCNLFTAIDDIGQLNDQLAYNISHPDTRALVKALDAFFSHGYACFRLADDLDVFQVDYR